MPRIRTIKPEFWSDEKLATVSEATLLVAIGLLNLADDEGYFNANPKLIDAFIFPLRESSMSTHGAISELTNIGYIEVFKCLKNEKDIGLVKNFLTHQVISRPTASKLAPIVDLSSSSVITHGVTTDSSQTERKGKEQGKEREGKGTCILSPKVDVDESFEKVWKQYPSKQNKKKALATFTAYVNKKKLDVEDFADYLIKDICERCNSQQFGFDKLHFTTYMNGERWFDEITQNLSDADAKHEAWKRSIQETDYTNLLGE